MFNYKLYPIYCTDFNLDVELFIQIQSTIKNLLYKTLSIFFNLIIETGFYAKSKYDFLH